MIKKLDDNNYEYKAYLHGEKHMLLNDLREAGVEVPEEAMEELAYAFYEVTLDCLVNIQTGAVLITGVDGATIG